MYTLAFAHRKAFDVFIKKALQWASLFDEFCYLNGNALADNHAKVRSVLAIGHTDRFNWDAGDKNVCFSTWQAFLDAHQQDWAFGFLNYELKDKIEALHTPQKSSIPFPLAFFFVPQYLLFIDEGLLQVKTNARHKAILQEIDASEWRETDFHFEGKVKPRISKAAYLRTFEKLREHIFRGDIYEINLCQEFYAENVSLPPLQAYWKLNQLSPTPFSCLFKQGHRYALCASPERFLAKRGGKLISQPIKGTARKENDEQRDKEAKNRLLQNPKERSENIMIVDLVRHDLTKSAVAGSVRVDELLGLYSFEQVHQLISTISCDIRQGISQTEAIANTFPPGSMTGAPKISAMKLIDKFETSTRGLYAGAIGYFSPDGDFDFNVVIRTLLYDEQQKRISYHVGGAITAQANAEEEYEECLLKAKAIMELLGQQ